MIIGDPGDILLVGEVCIEFEVGVNENASATPAAKNEEVVKEIFKLEKVTKTNPELVAAKAAEPVSIPEITHDEIDKIVEEIRIKKEKYKEDIKKQKVELHNQEEIHGKEITQLSIIGWAMLFVFFIFFAVLNESYGIWESMKEDEDNEGEILFWGPCFISIIIYARFVGKRTKNNTIVIESIKQKFDLINQDSFTSKNWKKRWKKRKTF